MGIVFPESLPSTLHETMEYAPSQPEWNVTVGISTFELMVFTIAVNTALPTLSRPAARR